MELCEKDVLTHLCSVGVSTEGQARLYGRQLISAFEYLHQKNIVHRDLKAENMMLDKNNNMKIIDFVRFWAGYIHTTVATYSQLTCRVNCIVCPMDMHLQVVRVLVGATFAAPLLTTPPVICLSPSLSFPFRVSATI